MTTHHEAEVEEIDLSRFPLIVLMIMINNKTFESFVEPITSISTTSRALDENAVKVVYSPFTVHRKCDLNACTYWSTLHLCLYASMFYFRFKTYTS